MQFVIAAEGCT